MSKQKKTTPDAIEKEPAPAPELASETLIGDLVSWVRDEMAALPSVWQSISEEGQKMVLDRLAFRAESIARQVQRILADDDMPAVNAELDSVQFKDGIKAALKIDAHAVNRHDLADAVGGYVRLIILPSIHDAHGGGMPKAAPDQAELPIDEEAA